MFKDIKKYVINLKRRPDRLASVLKEFEYMGIDVEVFEGIDTNSFVGCTRSHLSIIQMAYDNNLDSVIVFEDDILFTPYAKSLIIDIERELTNINYSVLCLNPSIQRPINISTESELLLDVTNLPPKKIQDNEIYSTGFMLYRREVFKPMLEQFTEYDPIDVSLTKLIYPYFKTYSPFIPLCYQSDSKSDISLNGNFSYESKTDYWNKNSPQKTPYYYFLGNVENKKHLDYKQIFKMKDTIVTGIFHSSPYELRGGRGYHFEHYKAPFKNLLNLNCNIVVFSFGDEIKKIKTFFTENNFFDYKIVEYNLNNYVNSEKLYELKKIPIYNDEGEKINNPNDRCHHLCLNKLDFIKQTINYRFFDSENYYWVDAGLFHHGLFPETFGGIERLTKVCEEKYWPINEKNVCNPSTISKLTNENNTGFIFIGQEKQFLTPKWWENDDEYSKTKHEVHIVGGLFGGKKNIVLELCDDFETVSTKILNDGYLILEEEVLSYLYCSKYSQYNHLKFKSWYHDIPTDPNYFGEEKSINSFYKIFI